MKAVVLDSMPIVYGGLDFKKLHSICELECHERTDDADFYERCKDADAILTNKVRLDKSRIDDLPNLKYIGVLATGYDVIDIDYASKKGIIVTNIPSYGTFATAQHTFALLLSYVNQVSSHAISVSEGDWQSSNTFSYFLSPLKELHGKTFGIVGYGRIGKQVANMAKSFGMKVIVHTRTPSDDSDITFVTCDEVLKQSDVLSLHCPLTPKTIKWINKKTLSLMKPESILINAARGGLIDEQALATALKEKQISHAFLDVLSSEPPLSDNPLIGLDNVTITPHIAWGSVEARKRLIDIAFNNLFAFKQGKPINVVNSI